MSYATKKESAKLKSMEKLCKKLSYDKEGNSTYKKLELKLIVDGKAISGTFYADVLHEMLEYYNTAD